MSKKSLVISIAVAVVLGAITGSLLVYGILSHTEAGLLEVCWGEDGSAQYLDTSQLETVDESDGQPCYRPEELVWPQEQIPLSVATIAGDGVTSLIPGSTPREAIDAAIVDINRQVGFTLFAPARDRTWSDVVVYQGKAVEVSVARARREKGLAPLLARVQHFRTGPSIRCHVVHYAHTGSVRHEYLVAHHELLHCAGLAHHPDNPSSAMYPLTFDDSMFERMHAARITDGHRSLLRKRYRKVPSSR